MTSIEVFFGVILLLFGLIGVVRGFLRELGVTLIMLFLLYFLSQFEPLLLKGLSRVVAVGRPTAAHTMENPICFWVFTVFLMGVAFVSYQGQTLTYPGSAPSGTMGFVLGAVTGLVNGYLIAGSVWYYMHQFNYPITWLGFSAEKLSSFSRGIIEFLPINFLGQPIFLGQSLLLYLAIMLLLARVIH
ncbi:MAG: hypothetical protein ACOX9A_01160 [Anaerolineae bacterium]